MKGSYRIVVKNRRVTYTIEIERAITIIRGDSATGKTSLIQSLAAYEQLHEKSGVSVFSSRPCRILRNSDWESRILEKQECIFFADEGFTAVASEYFAKAIRNTGHYYVLITRESLFQLPYSVHSVLELKKTTSRFKHTYNRSYPYYQSIPNLSQRLDQADLLITEDSNSGHEWFSCVAGRNGIACISAGGKSRILQTIRDTGGSRRIVAADGAAFGADMERVYQYLLLHPEELVLYLPESFEWIILKADILKDDEVSRILEHPSDFIDSDEYLSWEQYFTDLLVKKTHDTPLRYSKKKINPVFLQENNIVRMLEVVENGE